ncbi:uncharacterized protein N7498_003059 [Penicillium cinerascens]|uniref:xylan 1,4-beta-xylosidase n=1 Tax=Penicillium cinerascens TaxID=70096 RepID=A0A9W9NB87_9EURO|nr:uncharacterized protein N7498_003059 [Penicillium cinerascens]KAJ5216652.1 hypothetical protein N7498_003059 [Penicillium cinerascens]
MSAFISTAAAFMAAAMVLPSLAQDNTSYVNYNVEPQPNLYPETLETPRLRGFPDCQTGPLAPTQVCNTSALPSERAAALISLFTLDELLNHTGNTIPGLPRLGLPNYEVWSETLHGLDHADWASSGPFSWATSFPQAILTVASLNRTLFHHIGDIIGIQGRAFNNDGRFGLDGYDPNINGFRSPIWGRGQETPGEDTFCLTSTYAYQYITGLQGGIEPKTLQIASTAKHFAGYDIENWHGHSRLGNDLVISMQDLSEYYTPQFRVATHDARVYSVMCAYVAVNGVPSCTNSYFLQTLLRDTFDFVDDGYVTSDCDAVYVAWNPHGYAANWSTAAADGMQAGCDINCGQTYQRHLITALEDGQVSRREIERGPLRLYTTLVRLGYFDGNESAYRHLSWSDVERTDAWNVSYEAAVQATVLLKNENFLPLPEKTRNVAVIGPWSNATNQMQGNYYGPAPYFITPLHAFRSAGFNVNYAYGTGISSNSTAGFPAALEAAKKSDVIFYVGGIDSTVEAEGLDRENVTWTGNQLELIHRLTELGKPVVVASYGGGQLDDSTLKHNPNVKALLWGGYPGQSGGAALVDLITGKRAPAGRLPSTQYPAEYVNEFSQIDMYLRPNGSNPGQTYIWYRGKPVYEFGHGLFYTTFREELASSANHGMPGISGYHQKGHLISPAEGNTTFNIQDLLSQPYAGYTDVGHKPFINFTARITNDGRRTSDYTAMLFVNTTAGPAPYPNKWLIGFDRLGNVEPHESQLMNIPVPIESVSRTDEEGDRILYPGHYELALNNDRSVVLPFSLTGNPTIVYKWPRQEQEVPRT